MGCLGSRTFIHKFINPLGFKVTGTGRQNEMARPELKCFCPKESVRDVRERERERVCNEHTSSGINSGQMDSNEKEYSRTQLLHTNHV